MKTQQRDREIDNVGFYSAVLPLLSDGNRIDVLQFRGSRPNMYFGFLGRLCYFDSLWSRTCLQFIDLFV